MVIHWYEYVYQYIVVPLVVHGYPFWLSISDQLICPLLFNFKVIHYGYPLWLSIIDIHQDYPLSTLTIRAGIYGCPFWLSIMNGYPFKLSIGISKHIISLVICGYPLWLSNDLISCSVPCCSISRLSIMVIHFWYQLIHSNYPFWLSILANHIG